VADSTIFINYGKQLKMSCTRAVDIFKKHILSEH